MREVWDVPKKKILDDLEVRATVHSSPHISSTSKQNISQ